MRLRMSNSYPQHRDQDTENGDGWVSRKCATTLPTLPPELRAMIISLVSQQSDPLFFDSLRPPRWIRVTHDVAQQYTLSFFRNNAFYTIIYEKAQYHPYLGPCPYARPSTVINPRALRWLSLASCQSENLFRNVRFAFSYDPQGRDARFHLKYTHGRPVLLHVYCVFCAGLPFDLEHPYLQSSAAIGPLPHAAHQLFLWFKRNHDAELSHLNSTILRAYAWSHQGLSMQELHRVTSHLRARYSHRPRTRRTDYTTLSGLIDTSSWHARFAGTLRFVMDAWDRQRACVIADRAIMAFALTLEEVHILWP